MTGLWARKGLRVFVYFGITLTVIYGGLVAIVYFNQRQLVYPAPPVQGDTPSGFERVTIRTPDRLDLLAGYRPAHEGMPTLLFFHGNGATWQSSTLVTDRLVAQGYGLLAVEYRGYGGNPGTPSEEGLYQDARGAWAFLRAEGVDDAGIVLLGNSLGAAVALNLATEVHARALVLVSPFNNLGDTAARRMRWLPMRMLLHDSYANDEKIVQIGEPILILHGEEDSLIALEQAQALASVRDDTVIETFPGWGHDLIVNEAVQDRIAKFVEGVPSA